MFPAPGVYDALTTLLVITVSACTTPLNFDIAGIDRDHAGGDLDLLALIVTLAEAVTVMPLALQLDRVAVAVHDLDRAWPSFSVTFWPPGVSRMNFSCPSVSSSVTFTPLRERITFL